MLEYQAICMTLFYPMAYIMAISQVWFDTTDFGAFFFDSSSLVVRTIPNATITLPDGPFISWLLLFQIIICIAGSKKAYVYLNLNLVTRTDKYFLSFITPFQYEVHSQQMINILSEGRGERGGESWVESRAVERGRGNRCLPAGLPMGRPAATLPLPSFVTFLPKALEKAQKNVPFSDHFFF